MINEILPRVESSNEVEVIEVNSHSTAFIQANTVACTEYEIRNKHLIPVYVKDNEPLISQSEFIETTRKIVSEVFHGEQILSPKIRVSHPIKGRIPEAKDKPANQLNDNEKTLYYERMMFVIEIPSISTEVGGNKLSLTIGGVKAFNQDNLYNKKGADEHFKVFIGFQNKVCTNLCVWTDGLLNDLKVKNVGQLQASIYSLISSYQAREHIACLQNLTNFQISEQQFANLIGRCRMYQHLPAYDKTHISELYFGDNQLGAVCKDYYRDKSFCKGDDGFINLWKLYNLFTGANKSTYIDNFVDRSVNAYQFIEQVRWALQEKESNWYLN